MLRSLCERQTLHKGSQTDQDQLYVADFKVSLSAG